MPDDWGHLPDDWTRDDESTDGATPKKGNPKNNADYDMDKEDAKPTAGVPTTPVMDELAPFDHEGEYLTPMGEPIIGSPFDKQY